MTVYGIKDIKAGTFDTPMFQANKDIFKRNLINFISLNKTHLWSTNSSDFDVYELGEYDERIGVIKAHAPEYLFNLSEVLNLHE